MSRQKSTRAYRVKGASTKGKRKRTFLSEGSTEAYKAAKHVAYCPLCPMVANDPERAIHVTLASESTGKKVKCEKGHEFVTA